MLFTCGLKIIQLVVALLLQYSSTVLLLWTLALYLYAHILFPAQNTGSASFSVSTEFMPCHEKVVSSSHRQLFIRWERRSRNLGLRFAIFVHSTSSRLETCFEMRIPNHLYAHPCCCKWYSCGNYQSSQPCNNPSVSACKVVTFCFTPARLNTLTSEEDLQGSHACVPCLLSIVALCIPHSKLSGEIASWVISCVCAAEGCTAVV